MSSSGFFWTFGKKLQAKNSRETQNSRVSNCSDIFLKNHRLYEKNLNRYVKTQEKIQNSRYKLEKSALLGFLDAGKASKNAWSSFKQSVPEMIDAIRCF